MLTRRQTLKGTAAIAIAGTVPNMATAAMAPDPLLKLERQWLRQRHYANDEQPGETDEEREPAYEALDDIEDQIRETPAQSYDGLAVKMRLFAHRGSLTNRPEWWGKDCQDELALSVLHDLERLAKGG